METTFRIKTSDMDKKFLDMLKKLFKKKEIEITITDADADETSQLLSDSKNRTHLIEAIEEVKRNKNLVSFSGDEFEKYSKSLLKK
ncbi:MAG: hypothetical protein HY841_12385 [Bacteroidetes bacterium]|nr:hypothetical protein [Bacteroidota bacterium]